MDVLTVWVTLDVTKIVLSPSLLLAGPDAMLLVVCDRDVTKPMPEDVV